MEEGIVEMVDKEEINNKDNINNSNNLHKTYVLDVYHLFQLY